MEQSAEPPEQLAPGNASRTSEISPVDPAISPDSSWLRMDPELTRAVLAKTEEELLGGLAALMRNRVETEKAGRRLAQLLLDIEEARKELQSVKNQVRSAENELANRLAEQERIREATAGIEQPQSHQQEFEKLSVAHRALRDEHTGLLNERDWLLGEISQLNEEKKKLQTEGKEKAVCVENPQPSQMGPPEADEIVPLLLNHPLPKVTAGWDSYPLESELFTDDPLDAPRIADLVKNLPGLTGSLIVRNYGPVLASALPERFYDHLKVPHGNYNLLFERLPERVEESCRASARLATFRIGAEHLTVTQANHAFLIVSHEKPKLISGVPEKLVAITTELSRMYG